MKTLWIVLADEGRARIMERNPPSNELTDVIELSDESARADNAELRRDAFGRRASGGTGLAGNTTASAGEDKLDHAAESFARRVAGYLADEHRRGRFRQLQIVAAPRFLGRLRKQLDPALSKLVVDELDRDLLQLDRRALAERLGSR